MHPLFRPKGSGSSGLKPAPLLDFNHAGPYNVVAALKHVGHQREFSIKPFAPSRNDLRLFVRSLLLALLIVAVPALSTLAKDSWYLPQSNPCHYLNIASKMQVPHCPAVLGRGISETVARFIPVQPLARSVRTREAEAEPPLRSIAVTISLQHRSPPLIFA